MSISDDYIPMKPKYRKMLEHAKAVNADPRWQQVAYLFHDAAVGKDRAGAYNIELAEQALDLMDQIEESPIAQQEEAEPVAYMHRDGVDVMTAASRNRLCQSSKQAWSTPLYTAPQHETLQEYSRRTGNAYITGPQPQEVDHD